MHRGHLTTAQREVLRHALAEKRAELLRGIARSGEVAAEQETDSVELEDVAEGVIEDRSRARLEERDRRTLEEIEHALAKFESGKYGLSEVSGRPIPFERLKALPWTRYDEGEAERREHSAHR